MSYSIQIKCFVLFTEQGNSICLVAVRSGFRCRTSEEFENLRSLLKESIEQVSNAIKLGTMVRES